MGKLESISEDAEQVTKVAGAVMTVAMAGTALMWVGSSIKNAIVGRKSRKVAEKAEEKPEAELTV